MGAFAEDEDPVVGPGEVRPLELPGKVAAEKVELLKPLKRAFPQHVLGKQMPRAELLEGLVVTRHYQRKHAVLG